MSDMTASGLDRPAPASTPDLRQPQATAAEDGRLALPVKLFLLALVLPIDFDLGPLYLTGLRLLLLTMLPVLGIMLLIGRMGKIHPVDIVFMLHVIWIFVALSVNNPDLALQNSGITGAEFLGGYLITRAYIRNRSQFIALCKWLVVLALLMLPPALYETWTGRPILIELLRSLPGVGSMGVVTIEGRLGLERVQAVFTHPIHFGLFCSTAFSLAFVALKGVYSVTTRLVASALIFFTGFLSLSSGAILAIALQAALIGWFLVFRKVNARWWILFGLFALAYVVIDILSTRTPIRVFMSYATFSAHNAYWRGIIFDWGMMNIFGSENIPPARMFGIGLNDWVRPSFMHSGSMDNFWLVTGVRYGLPGLFLLVVGYVATLIGVGRRDFTGDETMLNLRRAWMFIFMGLSFTLVTVHVWTSIYSYVFFLFGAGVWMLTAEAQRADTVSETSPDTDPQTNPDPARREGSYSRFAPRRIGRARRTR